MKRALLARSQPLLKAFALQQRIKGCELVTIEGAGHACNMERPWEFDAHVLDFLKRRGLLPQEAKAAV